MRICSLMVWLCLALVPLLALADEGDLASHVIREIPETEDDVVSAHEGSKWKCRSLNAGEPLQIEDFTKKEKLLLPGSSSKKTGSTEIAFDYSRLEALSLGLDMEQADRKNLPLFSGGIIQRHLDSEYISIQIQVLRDTRSGAIYLYHQPFAAILHYKDQKNTHEFTDQSRASAEDFRGLGVYIKPGEDVTPENARTFVATNKCNLVKGQDASGKPKTADTYDLVMVRARVDGDEVTLHTFGTSEDRAQLHYLKPVPLPKSADDCSVKTMLIFTEYKLAGQVPVTSATRYAKYHGLASFEMQDLHKFAKEQGWKGGALVNLTETLDAIIDGKADDLSIENSP